MHADVLLQDFAQHRAKVRGQRQVTPLIELAVVESRPAAIDAAAFTSPPITNMQFAWPLRLSDSCAHVRLAPLRLRKGNASTVVEYRCWRAQGIAVVVEEL